MPANARPRKAGLGCNGVTVAAPWMACSTFRISKKMAERGEAELAWKHLTCGHAGERQATEGRAGVQRSHCRRAMDGLFDFPNFKKDGGEGGGGACMETPNVWSCRRTPGHGRPGWGATESLSPRHGWLVRLSEFQKRWRRGGRRSLHGNT